MLPRPFAIPAAALDCVRAYRRRLASDNAQRAVERMLEEEGGEIAGVICCRPDRHMVVTVELFDEDGATVATYKRGTRPLT